MNSQVILPLLIFVIGCTPKAKEKDNPVYSSEIEGRIERVVSNLQVETAINNVLESRTLASQMAKYNTPGLSIAVINDGKIEWARGFGIRDETTNDGVDTQTLFEAGSVSKPTFALTVMKLKEKGLLDLDKDVNAYLTSWKVPANEDWQPRLTLRQLLSHTAGLTGHGFPGYLLSEPIPTLPQILNGEIPANTAAVKVNILPGTTFRYAGGGTTVAQLTIMDILKKPFPDIAREELFAPLRLRHSTYQQPLPDSLESLASTAFPWKGQPIKGRFHVYPEMAAAGLWTNPSELATLLIEVQRALKGESTFYKKETIEEMLTPQKVAPNIGIGFFLESKGDSARFEHGGWDEGFVTAATAYKKLGKGAVVMVNSNQGNALLDEILKAIAIEYQWPDFITAPKKENAITPDDLKTFIGSYSSDNNEFKIEAKGEKLFLVYQQQPPLPLVKLEDGTLKSKLLNFSLLPDKEGLKFSQQGKSTLYKKKQTRTIK